MEAEECSGPKLCVGKPMNSTYPMHTPNTDASPVRVLRDYSRHLILVFNDKHKHCEGEIS